MAPSINTSRSLIKQRGEGKLGCIVSLLVLLLLVGVGIKAIPVYWSNNELKDAAKDLASRASVQPEALIEQQLRAKAKELEIPEALAAGAIVITKSGDKSQGTCTVRLHYSRKIDFFGVTSYTLDTEDSVSSPYLDAR